jgi:hypothetical protein
MLPRVTCQCALASCPPAPVADEHGKLEFRPKGAHALIVDSRARHMQNELPDVEAILQECSSELSQLRNDCQFDLSMVT